MITIKFNYIVTNYNNLIVY